MADERGRDVDGLTLFLWAILCLMALSSWLGDRRMGRLERAVERMRIELREGHRP